MNVEEFRKRTKVFAIEVIRLVESLPKFDAAQVIGRQLLRSGTSVGANYRSACLAKSRADFIAKMKIVEEECDESLYWMELLVEVARAKPANLTTLAKEAREILRMSIASIKTSRSRM